MLYLLQSYSLRILSEHLGSDHSLLMSAIKKNNNNKKLKEKEWFNDFEGQTLVLLLAFAQTCYKLTKHNEKGKY